MPDDDEVIIDEFFPGKLQWDIPKEDVPVIKAQMFNINFGGEKKKEEPMAGKILKTVGTELESLGLTQDKVKSIMRTLPEEIRNNFKVYRDGSSEIKAYMVPIKSGKKSSGYCSFNSHTDGARNAFRNMVTYTSGYELISVPMEIETFETTIKSVLPKLEMAGDFLSERCATHIHVGMKNDVDTLKKLLKLGLWADELFFSISGMGGRYRGWSNNSIYARPLINGQCFKCDGSWYRTLNYEKALEAEDVYEFFSTYAINTHRDAIKYHPARYFSINIYSVLLHNTIEFRHFNQTFDADLVCSAAKLCQLFAEIALKADISDLEEFKVCDPFELKSSWYYLDKLQRLLYLGKELDCTYIPDRRDVSILERIIRRYKGMGVDNLQVKTHLKDYDIDYDMLEIGKLERVRGKVLDDGHTDIHNIKNSSILESEENI